MWLVWGMTLHFRNVLKCSQVSSRGDELSALKTETMSPEAQGARGSQGANQVCHRFNSFVLCLIGCWARLGFLWPQLETSVKRLDGHSESVNCFQQSASLTVPLFPKSRPVPCLTIYLVHEVFTESCISRLLVCMPVFATSSYCSSSSSAPGYQFSCFYFRSDWTRSPFSSSPPASRVKAQACFEL